MKLVELQRQAFQIAESQGHHDNLKEGLRVSRRHAALYDLALVYEAVTVLAQQLTRHGVEDQATIEHLGHLLAMAVGTFRIQHREMMRLPEEAGVRTVTPTIASTIRLVLLHTDVSAAMTAVHDGQAPADAFAHALAALLIRVGDLAEGVAVDVETATQAVMAAEWSPMQEKGEA